MTSKKGKRRKKPWWKFREHSQEYLDYLASQEWKAMREKALEFYHHRCVLCRSTFNLHVHHNTYERLGHEELDDLVVLCQPCHKHHHRRPNVDEALERKAARQKAHEAKNDLRHMERLGRDAARAPVVAAALAAVQAARPTS